MDVTDEVMESALNHTRRFPLGLCLVCHYLPDTPNHELGCPVGRRQYADGEA